MTRFCTVSATYRVPARLSPTPVGPRTNAAALVCSAKPEPILVLATTRGGRWPKSRSRSLTTVPRCTTLPPAATVPFSTLVTNTSAVRPY